MKITILNFGITKEIIGTNELTFALQNGNSVADLRQHLYENYPNLKALRSLAIAVNQEYASENQLIQSSDEIALIPPVSGG